MSKEAKTLKDSMREDADKFAEKLGVKWTDDKVAAEMVKIHPDLLTKELEGTKSYIRAHSVSRAWDSRRALFGDSGYVKGKHPRAGTGKADPKPSLTDEEKKERRSKASTAAWKKRKELYGESGYKPGKADPAADDEAVVATH